MRFPLKIGRFQQMRKTSERYLLTQLSCCQCELRGAQYLVMETYVTTFPFPKKALLWPVLKKKLNCDVDITSQDDMNQVHKYIERLKNRKGAGE